MNRAIIVGSEGQDGRLLFERLERDGYDVVGLGRGTARASGAKTVRPVDIADRAAVRELLADMEAADVFFLATVHQSSEDTSKVDDALLFERSWIVHVKGLINFLEPMADAESGRLFYAASSHVFGEPDLQPQTETTPFKPDTPYAITKAAGVRVCQFYRRNRNVKASSGILFNHESPLRKPTFLSKKISTAAVRIAKSGQGQLTVGNLAARNDWGYAPDFVDAMIRIVINPAADDFVVATGESHSVQEFVEIAFDHVGLDWRDHVVEDQRILTRVPAVRVGDSTRLRQATGWAPTLSFEAMVRTLVDAAALDS